MENTPEKRRERERKRKKKKKKRYSSSSEDSEAEDRRITKKAKKKLGLSDSEEEIELTVRERDARTVVATQLRRVFSRRNWFQHTCLLYENCLEYTVENFTSHKIRERDLKDFFSSVGDVRQVKLVKDEIHKTQGFYSFFVL